MIARNFDVVAEAKRIAQAQMGFLSRMVEANASASIGPRPQARQTVMAAKPSKSGNNRVISSLK